MSFSTVIGKPSAASSSEAIANPFSAGMFSACQTRPVCRSTTPGTPATACRTVAASTPAAAISSPASSAAAATMRGASMPCTSTSCRAAIAAPGPASTPRSRCAPRSRASACTPSGLGPKNTAPCEGSRAESGDCVTRPVASSSSSSTETVGLEMPVRRAISAREIGWPPSITDHTVRMFISRSVAAVTPEVGRTARMLMDAEYGVCAAHMARGRDPRGAGGGPSRAGIGTV